MASVSLKMAKSGILYTHDGNGKVIKAVSLNRLQRMVLSKLNQALS